MRFIRWRSMLTSWSRGNWWEGVRRGPPWPPCIRHSNGGGVPQHPCPLGQFHGCRYATFCGMLHHGCIPHRPCCRFCWYYQYHGCTWSTQDSSPFPVSCWLLGWWLPTGATRCISTYWTPPGQTPMHNARLHRFEELSFLLSSSPFFLSPALIAFR